jgi:hypothetical protein
MKPHGGHAELAAKVRAAIESRRSGEHGCPRGRTERRGARRASHSWGRLCFEAIVGRYQAPRIHHPCGLHTLLPG